MTVTADDQSAVSVVEVVGVLDAGSLEQVRAQLRSALDEGAPRTVVDLARCPFVDAAALTMLLELHRDAWRSGRVLALRGCTPRVLRLLSLTGLRGVFEYDLA